MQAVVEAETRLQEDLNKLDQTLERAYKHDKEYRNASDTLQREQNRRIQLITDLTTSYRSTQRSI